MALYKVNDDKAFKILMATSPSVIFINGPRYSDYLKFFEKFKETDLNMLQLTSVFQRLSNKFVSTSKDIENYFATGDQTKPDLETAFINDLRAYIDRSDRVVIVGCLANAELIGKIFDTFTYVYIYPQDSKYKENITSQLKATSDPKLLDSTITTMLKRRKKEFKEHIDLLGRALVVIYN